MAGAWLQDLVPVALERPAEKFDVASCLGAWLGELLPVALERPADGFEAFEGGQTAGSNALKNRWLGRGCESCCQLPWKGLRIKTDEWGMWFEGKQTAGSLLKNRWLGARLGELLPVALERPAEGLKRLRAGKRQARTPLKTDGWGVAARVVASCLGKACGRVWSVWRLELAWKGLHCRFHVPRRRPFLGIGQGRRIFSRPDTHA